MILEYAGRNCWCFEDWVEIDFKLNKNVPEEYGFNGVRVVPFLCFEGANASGKSSALKVLSFIRNFAAFSFHNQPDAGMYYSSFFHNDDPSDFKIKFSLTNRIDDYFIYKFKVTEKIVKSESLEKYSKKEKTLLFKRTTKKLSINNWFDVGGNFILRNNASVISTAHQYGISEVEEVYRFFAQIYTNVFSLSQNNSLLDNYTFSYYYKHEDVLNRIVEELKRFDTGINKVIIHEYKRDDGTTLYMPVFEHNADVKQKYLVVNEESIGTQQLFVELLEIYFVLQNGGILILDELDCHLHSEIVGEILNYFLDEKRNLQKAQLLFTSHDISLLDKAKKYRSYLFEKDKGSAYAYRIDEIKDKDLLRNDKPLSPVYKSGIIGGVPNVEKSSKEQPFS